MAILHLDGPVEIDLDETDLAKPDNDPAYANEIRVCGELGWA